MNRENTFRLAAKNSLKVTERDPAADKALLHTLQGGHDLRQELTRAFNQKGKTLIPSNSKAFETTK